MICPHHDDSFCRFAADVLTGEGDAAWDGAGGAGMQQSDSVGPSDLI
jgi:hypothetical protein